MKRFDPHETINDFMPSIKYWAHHYSKNFGRVIETQDLITVGVIGLLDAIKKYNPHKKNQFKTYAEFRIRGEIIDELRRMDWLSRSDRKKQKVIEKKNKELSESLGRIPSNEELANVLPFKRSDTHRLEGYQSKPHQTFNEKEHSQNIRDDVWADYFKHSEWNHLLGDLPELMQKIIYKKYFKDQTFLEIGAEIHLTEGRISQIHTEAIKLLQEKISSDDAGPLAA
jgi:RNA polymerase sigma factor for flagellar operon FliA